MTGGEKVGRPADPPRTVVSPDCGSGGASEKLARDIAALVGVAWDWRAYALQQEARAEAAEARVAAVVDLLPGAQAIETALRDRVGTLESEVLEIQAALIRQRREVSK